MQMLRDLEHETLALLRTALAEKRFGEIAAVSSFGAESAVLLHLISRVDPATPVMFINTRMLFQETLDYKDELVDFLGLSDVRTLSPDIQTVRKTDPWGRMHLSNPDACCDFRKTRPLDEALTAFNGWITGRKRYQAFTRIDLQHVERTANDKIRLNPMADWPEHAMNEYSAKFDLPQHPLINHGYASIGCASCTSAVRPGEDARAGRWRGTDKVECGIHFENGKIVRETQTNV